MSDIRLFRPNETNFDHNEWVLNEIISCKVTEEINGDYTAELEYPLEDSKGISSNIAETFILSIPTIDDRQDQLFRIIDKQTTNNSVIVQCQSKLLADLKENAIRPATLTNLTRKQAIIQILNNCLDTHSYIVGNLDNNSNTNVILTVPESNPLTAIIGDKSSVLTEYGGEYRIDNNKLDVIDSRGADNGVVIEYGKNLSSIKVDANINDLATVLIPKSGDYRLPEYYIESPRVNQYEKRYFKDVELSLDIWDGDGEKGENQITIEEAYITMRETCKRMFIEDKVDQVTFNYTLDFIELRKTEEYKNYSILETVHIGDTVTIKHKKLNLNLQGRVNKITYMVDSDGITSIDTVEIGFSKKQITDIVKDTAITANAASNKINQITETSSDGVTTELSKKAFKVTCSKASGTNVTIDAEGLTVNNGKILVKNSNGDIVFTVNVEGKCTAIQGFSVEDGEQECCSIDKTGVQITNENGYTSKISVVMDSESASLLFPDHARFKKNVHIEGTTELLGDCTVDGDFGANGNFWIKGQSLTSIIQDMIDASMPSDSGSGE